MNQAHLDRLALLNNAETLRARQFNNTIDSIFSDIKQERLAQNIKWTPSPYGVQIHNLFVWLGILTEEIGESHKAALDAVFTDCLNVGDPQEKFDSLVDHMRVELVQSAAVIVALIERIDANQGELFRPEPQNL